MRGIVEQREYFRAMASEPLEPQFYRSAWVQDMTSEAAAPAVRETVYRTVDISRTPAEHAHQRSARISEEFLRGVSDARDQLQRTPPPFMAQDSHQRVSAVETKAVTMLICPSKYMKTTSAIQEMITAAKISVDTPDKISRIRQLHQL